MSKTGKFVGGGGAVAVVLIGLSFFQGCPGGLGFGGGGNGNSIISQFMQQEESEAGEAESTDMEQIQSIETVGEPATEIPSKIIVRIVEDQVTINDNLVKDDSDLEYYLEQYNNDHRTFVLETEYAIKATYDWVVETFEKKGIKYFEENP